MISLPVSLGRFGQRRCQGQRSPARHLERAQSRGINTGEGRNTFRTTLRWRGRFQGNIAQNHLDALPIGGPQEKWGVPSMDRAWWVLTMEQVMSD